MQKKSHSVHTSCSQSNGQAILYAYDTVCNYSDMNASIEYDKTIFSSPEFTFGMNINLNFSCVEELALLSHSVREHNC